jgi:hypothetical protein
VSINYLSISGAAHNPETKFQEEMNWIYIILAGDAGDWNCIRCHPKILESRDLNQRIIWRNPVLEMNVFNNRSQEKA